MTSRTSNDSALKPETARLLAADIAIVLLSLVSIFLLVFEVLAEHTPQQLQALEAADTIIACIFLGEFFYGLARADNRRRYWREHWWELLAAIPINTATTQVLRGLRLFRVFRLIRLLRLIRFIVRFKILLGALARFSEKTHLLYISTIAGMVVMSGALGFHYMEAGVNPNVHNLFDSFWWTVTTVTTVGYGDIYPVTTGGRILAIFLMLGGIAMVSAVTATIAAYLVQQKDEK